MKQLSLPLYSSLQTALESPEAVDLGCLWEEVEAAIVDLDCPAQLQVAGDAISKIAAVFAARSELAFADLTAAATQEGPVMRLEEFSGYVRQTMQIDLEQYIEPIPMLDVPAQPAAPWSAWHELSVEQEDEFSVVSEVSASVLEEWIGLLQGLTDVGEAAQMEKIKDLSHGEDIEAWAKELHTMVKKLRKRKQKLSFLDLVDAVMQARQEQTLQECSSDVWLAFLLGDHPYQLRRTADDFYSASGIEVVMKDCLD